MKKASKYRNVKTKIDGITFDSKKEAARYGELRILERAGRITDLVLQPRFVLEGKGGELKYPTGRRVRYYADFQYIDVENDGELVIEDVKGMRTDTYKLKRAIMESMGLPINEV